MPYQSRLELVIDSRSGERQLQRLEKGLDGVDRKGGKVAITTQKVGAMATAAAGALAGLTVGTGIFAAIARQSSDAAVEIERLARISSTSVESFQRMAYAAGQFNVEQSEVADILRDVQDRIGDFLQTGAGEFADFFENIAPQVGLTADELARMSGPEALQAIYNALDKANLSASEMTFYMESLASNSTELIPLLQNGGDALSEMGDEADRTGRILSNLEIQRLKDIRSEFHALEQQLTVETSRAVSQFDDMMKSSLEGISWAIENVSRGFSAFMDYFRENDLKRSIVGIDDELSRVFDDKRRLELRIEMYGADSPQGQDALAALDEVKTSYDELIDRKKELLQEPEAFEPPESVSLGRVTATNKSLERQADALESLRREFDPMRAAQTDYNERLGMLNEALARGVVSQEEYGRGIRWAADQLQQAAVDADPYLSRLKAINEEYVRGQSLGELFAQQQAANSITGPAGEIARSGIDGRIEDQVMQGAPVVEGLEPEYGGAFGELQRIQQEREALQAWYDEKIAMYQQYRELEAENAAQYDSVLRDLRQSRAEAEIAIQQQERSAILSGSASMFGSLAQMSAQYAGDSAGITKALIGFQQVANIAQMLGYLGVGTARQFADLPWYAAVGTAASVGAQIGSLLSMVKGVETPSTPSFSASSYAGAFDNGGNIPTGKWGIAGEYGPEIIEGPARVTSRKQTAEMFGQQSQGNHTTVNVIEDASRAGQVNERQDTDGKTIIDVVVANITGDGQIHKAMSGKYALSTKGR